MQDVSSCRSSDGNKTINRLWLGPEQSESSTADMRTHSRHVSREPRAPGTPGRRSICKSFPPHTQNKPAPPFLWTGAGFCCLQRPVWLNSVYMLLTMFLSQHQSRLEEKPPRELKNMWFNAIMHVIMFTKWKNGNSISATDVKSWSHPLLSISAKWPQRSHASHYSSCFLTSPISRSGFNYVLSQRTLLTVFQGHFNGSHCSGRWMQRTW